ncbi:MAG: glycosyltransferase family 2 protein [Acidimicrobiales bacterium]
MCIPTLDPGRWVDRLTSAIASQTLRPDSVLVIDSSSTDGSVDRFAAIGAEILRIPRSSFDHGGTRNLALDSADADVYLFLTQDAIPADDRAFEELVDGLLADDRTGAAYGRQVPRPGATSRARAHRAFNYPAESARRTATDVPELGVRAAFSSNSFAAYRRAALDDVGAFPAPVVCSEDRYVAARLLQAGWAMAYVATARVEHSHDYRLVDDFRRYFDIGVFQVSNPWFESYLGRPEREGRDLLRAQVNALRQDGIRLAGVRVAARGGISWLGFRGGRAHRWLPTAACSRWSMTPAYWEAGEPRQTANRDIRPNRGARGREMTAGREA